MLFTLRRDAPTLRRLVSLSREREHVLIEYDEEHKMTTRELTTCVLVHELILSLSHTQ